MRILLALLILGYIFFLVVFLILVWFIIICVLVRLEKSDEEEVA